MAPIKQVGGHSAGRLDFTTPRRRRAAKGIAAIGAHSYINTNRHTDIHRHMAKEEEEYCDEMEEHVVNVELLRLNRRYNRVASCGRATVQGRSEGSVFLPGSMNKNR